MTVLTLEPDETTGQDVYIASDNPNSNFDFTHMIEVGDNNGVPGQINRGLIKFDLSSLPSNAVISSAVLSLYLNSDFSSNTRTFRIYRLKRVWTETGVTWNKYDGTNSWQSPGGFGVNDCEQTDIGSRSMSASETTGVYKDFSLTPTTKAALDLGNGWLIKADTESDDGYEFLGSNFAAGTRPKLTITYTLPPSDPIVSQAVTVSESRQLSIASTISKSDAVSVNETLSLFVFSPFTFKLFEPVLLSEQVSLTVSSPQISVSQAVTVTDVATLAKTHFISVSDAISVNAQNVTVFRANLSVFVNDAVHVDEFIFIGKPVSARDKEPCFPTPLLYITDGTRRPGGQLNMLNLLAENNGFLLNAWKPAVSQYRDGGQFSQSPLASGRRLVRKVFDNVVEVMELRAKGNSQNNLIDFTQQLSAWQEAASDYWTSDWSTPPIYLVARGAKETNTRYALLHVVSFTELPSPYEQPFFSPQLHTAYDSVTLRLERGHWTSTPPGVEECVPVGTSKEKTVTTFTPISAGLTGNITSLIQIPGTGDLLAGTDDTAKVYVSTDGGVTWTLRYTLGAAGGDVVRQMILGRGNVIVAVVGGPTDAKRGLWTSSNGGVTWTQYLSLAGMNREAYGVAYSPSFDVYAISGQNTTGISGFIGRSGGYNNLGWTFTTHTNGEQLKVVLLPPSSSPEAFFLTSSHVPGFNLYLRPWTVNAGGGYSFLVSDAVNVLPTMSGSGFSLAANSYPYGDGYVLIGTSDGKIWRASLNQGNYLNVSEIATLPSAVTSLYIRPFSTVPTSGGVAVDENGRPIVNLQQVDTVYAGVNGEVYVSYNSGYSWVLLTSDPTIPVKAMIVPTLGPAQNQLIIGDALSVTGPPQEGIYQVLNLTYGQEPTCLNGAYVGNQTRAANLSHVKISNAGVFSDLQFDHYPPYTLYPSPPKVDDALYFGVETGVTGVESNRFNSVVFDITDEANDLTTISWEYWNGSSWIMLTVQDNTNKFANTGVSSVHWIIPSDWSTTTVDGVTGYWVRARIAATGSNPVAPIHDNRFIYTVTNGCVEIMEDEVQGDIPASARVKWKNESDDPGATLLLEADRVLIGLRSFDRGPSFNAYLNISDQQVPFGMSLSPHSFGAWVNNPIAPTGRDLSINFTSGSLLNSWQDLVTFTVDNTIARDYYGCFRVFLRMKQGSGSPNVWQFRLKSSFGTGGGSTVDRTAFSTVNTEWQVLDMGHMNLPVSQVSHIGGNLGDSMKIIVQGYCTTLSVPITLYDLVLIPVDEWASDLIMPELSITATSEIHNSNYLDVDSISNPKIFISGFNRTLSDQIRAVYRAVTNGPAFLQVNKRQCLWFFAMSYENYWRGRPDIVGSVKVSKQQKYLTFRGRK